MALVALVIFGTAIFVAGATILVQAWRTGTLTGEFPSPFNLGPTAGNHAQVSGTLAGFAIGIVVLLASLSERGGSTNYGMLVQETMLMLLSAFLGLIGAALTYSAWFERQDPFSSFCFTIASLLYYPSVYLLLLALNPLLGIIGYELVRGYFTWLLLGLLLAGYIAVCTPLIVLMQLRPRVCLAVFLLASSVVTFHFGLAQAWPILLPTSPHLYVVATLILLALTFVTFYVSALPFLWNYDEKKIRRLQQWFAAVLAGLIVASLEYNWGTVLASF